MAIQKEKKTRPKPQGYRGVPSKEKTERLEERKEQILSAIAPRVSPEQLTFLNWLAMPLAMRDPPTQKEYAQQIEVTEKTLCDWKRNLDLMEGYKDLVILYLIEYEIPDCLRAMSKKAKSGSSHAFNALMEALGLVAPKATVAAAPNITVVIQNQIAGLSEDTLKALVAALDDLGEGKGSSPPLLSPGGHM